MAKNAEYFAGKQKFQFRAPIAHANVSDQSSQYSIPATGSVTRPSISV